MPFRNSGAVCGCSLDFFPSHSGNSDRFWLRKPWWPWQLLYLWALRDKYSIEGPPFSHLTLSFQVKERNNGCVALWVRRNSFSFSIVPTSSFCVDRTFWRNCNYNVFERASTFCLFLLSPKTDISTLTSILNLVSNTILVVGLSRWKSSITNDRLVHIST